MERSLVPSVSHQWKMEPLSAVEVPLWLLEALVLLSELHRQHQPNLPSNQTLSFEEGGPIQFRRGCWKVLDVWKHTITGSPNGYRMEDRTCIVHYANEENIKTYSVTHDKLFVGAMYTTS